MTDLERRATQIADRLTELDDLDVMHIAAALVAFAREHAARALREARRDGDPLPEYNIDAALAAAEGGDRG